MLSLRVLVVDDHPLARRAIAMALVFCRLGHPEIIGEAGDGATAIEMAKRLIPDIITMDIGLPDMSGLEVTSRLKTVLPDVEVIVVTAHWESEYRSNALKAGASAFVTKEHVFDELPGWLDILASARG